MRRSVLDSQKTASATKAAYRSVKYTVGESMRLWPWILASAKSAWKYKQQVRSGEISAPKKLSPEQKFGRLMNAFGKRPSDLPALRAQSATAALLWGFAAIAFATMATLGQNGVSVAGVELGGLGWNFPSIARLIAPLALGLMALRHAQANWIFRTQRHGDLLDFVKSGDWLPRR